MKITSIYISVLFLLSGVSTSPIVAQALDMHSVQHPQKDKWYKIVTKYKGADKRTNRCIQLYPKGKKEEYLLYSNSQLSPSNPQYEYQLWKFEQNPANPDEYAIINKGEPNGYLSIVPVDKGNPVSINTISNHAKWEYIPEDCGGEEDKYGFIIWGNRDSNSKDWQHENHDACITSSYLLLITGHNGKYPIFMNCGDSDEGYAVNVFSDKENGDANIWEIQPVE